MELDELSKLEEKVKNLVDNLKRLKDENENLKLEMDRLAKESSFNNDERNKIRKKVTTLIELIDSIQQE
jgi:septation ring formation regulator EzrA